MTTEQRQAPPPLTYEVWKIRFRKDCESKGRLIAFNSLGEPTLKRLWAIVESIDGLIELSPDLGTDRLAHRSATERTKP